MNNDKDSAVNNSEDNNNNVNNGQNNEQNIPLRNPLTGAESNVTQEDIDNEQKFKEAATERD